MGVRPLLQSWIEWKEWDEMFQCSVVVVFSINSDAAY